MHIRVLEWEGLPLRSEKESAAHKYSMLLERLKERMQHDLHASFMNACT